MADRYVDHLLIGGGVASAACAQALRDAGAPGSILLVSRESDAPYHRPPASKGYLQGTESREQVSVLPDAFYEQASVEMQLRTSVLSLDPVARIAKLSTREEIAYGTALLATGAMVRRLQIEGAQLAGIHYLRSLANADAIRSDLQPGSRVVLVGGSYIGCEVAASLTELGHQCTIIMREEEPVETGFGRTVGRAIRNLLTEHGITVIAAAEVSEFAGTERVGRVLLTDGQEISADLVVCGAGSIPDVALARRAGLELGPRGGVLCDGHLATTAAGLFAAGDICEYASELHGRPARIEHERVAQAQGLTVAHNMLGAGELFTSVPSFWSDLSSWATLEYVGLGASWDHEVIRGDLDNADFAAFQIARGRLVGAISVNGHADLGTASELIASAAPVLPGELELMVDAELACRPSHKHAQHWYIPATESADPVAVVEAHDR